MDIGMYLHIPFCLTKCYYCDFTSYLSEPDQYKTYTKALVDEIKAYSADIKHDVTIKTIFIGGGTPSVLPPILLEKIIKNLNQSFHIAKDVEFTIESNPGTLSKDQLIMMKSWGVNRISMGLQAYQDHLLKKIGRSHSWAEFVATYNLCRQLGFNNINVDLMFALPGQTLEEWQETLQAVVQLNVDHISAYSLIIEEETPFGQLYDQGKLQPLDEDLERQMYHEAKAYLGRKGYSQYEISNFSKVGKASQHNVDCWNSHSYIGLGLGAHSYFKGCRYANTNEMDEYLAASTQLKQIQRHKEIINLQAQMEEFMFLGLRLTDGIKIEDFKLKFGQTLNDVYGDQIKQHKENGLLKEESGRIFLTSFGQDVSNTVFSSFL